MRPTLYTIAGIAALAILPPSLVRGILASTAATLIEATPFLLLGLLLARIPALSGLIAYAGCGCIRGPSARSIPGAAAAWLLFGPMVACARLITGGAAALVIGRMSTPGSGPRDGGEPHVAIRVGHASPSLVDELHALLLPAMVAASVLAFVPSSIGRAPFIAQIGLGAILGFLAAPCALGTIAVAGALHVTAPAASVAFLCIAGIVDLRALTGLHQHNARTGDSFAMAIVAIVLLIVAARHGAALVNPRASIALAITGVVTLALVFCNRSRGSLASYVAPAIMLAGALFSAPAPMYHATETTLTDLFVGEQLTFEGTLDHESGVDSLVRFAITCCRADATPLVIRLVQPIAQRQRGWFRATGSIVRVDDELRLRADHVDPISPPTDPFVYR